MRGVEEMLPNLAHIEGAEYKVFRSASENLLRNGRLRNIAIEYKNSVFEARCLSPDHINQRLLSCGYLLNHSLGPWVYEFTGS